MLYVWRFQSEESAVEGERQRSIPRSARGSTNNNPGPSTFSRFDPWDKCTAEEHASAVLKTLGVGGRAALGLARRRSSSKKRPVAVTIQRSAYSETVARDSVLFDGGGSRSTAPSSGGGGFTMR